VQVTRSEEQWVQRLEWNRRRLLELARQAGAGGGKSPVLPGGDREAGGEGDRADVARRVQEHASSMALLGILADNEEQIERALARILDGRYGICEDCGGRIPDERLRIRPEATRCVPCQARSERLAQSV
jgi:DnaK suppressor protein